MKRKNQQNFCAHAFTSVKVGNTEECTKVVDSNIELT
jgi:hypothetical protein